MPALHRSGWTAVAAVADMTRVRIPPGSVSLPASSRASRVAYMPSTAPNDLNAPSKSGAPFGVGCGSLRSPATVHPFGSISAGRVQRASAGHKSAGYSAAANRLITSAATANRLAPR